MRVDHISFSKTGGAGQVATVLASAQQYLGIDSRLISLISGDLRNEPLSEPKITVAAALDHYAVSSHTSPTLVSHYRSKLSELKDARIREDSIIHLHWISGVITNFDVRQLLANGRKVVWTLHDMAPFTGVCHHAHGCRGFEKNCGSCPQVKRGFRKSVEVNLSQKVIEKIEQNLVLVAPTQWLASQARKSTALGNQRIEVIENPIRPEFFQGARAKLEMQAQKERYPNSDKPFIFAAVATDLSDPAKGIEHLVGIFTKLRTRFENLSLYLVGRRGESFQDPLNGVHWLGMLGVEDLVRVASETDLLISTSAAESAGLIVREFASVGVPTAAIRAGGISDLIASNLSGLLCENLAELESQLGELLASDSSILKGFGVHAKRMSQINEPSFVASEYEKLYRGLIRGF